MDIEHCLFINVANNIYIYIQRAREKERERERERERWSEGVDRLRKKNKNGY